MDGGDGARGAVTLADGATVAVETETELRRLNRAVATLEKRWSILRRFQWERRRPMPVGGALSDRTCVTPIAPSGSIGEAWL